MSKSKEAHSAELAEWFALHERLYNLTVEYMREGGKIPDDEELPGYIALDIVMQAIESCVQPPNWATNRVTKDWKSFTDCNCRSLHDAFGFPARTSQQLARKKRTGLALRAYSKVLALQAKGLKAGVAKQEAADEMLIDIKKFESLQKEVRNKYRNLGRNPDEVLAPKKQPGYANAHRAISLIITNAIRPPPKKTKKI